LDGIDLEEAGKWLQEQADRPDICAIGEAGLDKACKTSWELQMLAFQQCVAVSESTKKPLILHCVRAYSEIIALKKKWKPSQTWIFHGFDKNLPTAAMALRAGCYLSFGSALFKENSHAAESLLATPDDRLFLETDTAAISIEAVYEKAASIRGLRISTLEQMLERQLSLFGNLQKD
jgi:TatD DNase family protein